jgi:23S rRNA pseudouridine955/2504/2580 synthase
LLKLIPETGRKHQIRKQLLMVGNPIFGDAKYRLAKDYSKKDTRLMLHAHKIAFSINGIKYNFTAEIPLDFKKNIKEKYLKNF